MKFLIVEVTRPGSFDGRGSILHALAQARRYATDLNVSRIAVSDGCVLEAYDLLPGGLRPRVVAHLADCQPPENLWWLSTRGIYVHGTSGAVSHGVAAAVSPGRDRGHRASVLRVEVAQREAEVLPLLVEDHVEAVQDRLLVLG